MLRSGPPAVANLDAGPLGGSLAPAPWLVGQPVRTARPGACRAIAHPREAQVAPAVPPLHVVGNGAPLPAYTRKMSSGREGVADVAYELIQGALVRYCIVSDTGKKPPTAVLVHGILGNRRNMLSFAKMITQACPSWQVLVVDLRCHGESAAAGRPHGPNGVESAAADLLKLLGRLRLFPDVLVGHSFGGKVVLSMAEQFGRVGRTLPKPVQVWVLDSLPGEVRAASPAAGSGSGGSGGGHTDHPERLIRTLQQLRVPVADRRQVVAQVAGQGFSQDVARWAATNLRPIDPANPSQGWEWACDLAGIAEMYHSYEATHLWHLICQPQQGLKIDFVKAEHSTFRWGGEDEHIIRRYGHGVHLLRGAGHWVHTDNPAGLLEILKPSLGQAVA